MAETALLAVFRVEYFNPFSCKVKTKKKSSYRGVIRITFPSTKKLDPFSDMWLILLMGVV